MKQLGYTNYYQVLNAKDYGIPQNRERVFTISIRKDVDKGYIFPQPQELKLKLKDMLEDEVDEKYYLSEKAIEKLKRHNNKVLTNNKQDTSSTIHSGYYKMGGRDQQYIKTEVVRKYGLYPTLDTTQGDNRQHKIIVDDTQGFDGIRFYDKYCPTLRAGRSGLKTITNIKIRKLTPLETWRLMGFDDEDFEKANQVNSNTQLYKQAGNSIVVDVLVAIFSGLDLPKRDDLD